MLAALLTDLVGADPLSLDLPGAEAGVVGVITSEVAVLDQTTAGVAAVEVDDFELAHVGVREDVDLATQVGLGSAAGDWLVGASTTIATSHQTSITSRTDE